MDWLIEILESSWNEVILEEIYEHRQCSDY